MLVFTPCIAWGIHTCQQKNSIENTYIPDIYIILQNFFGISSNVFDKWFFNEVIAKELKYNYTTDIDIIICLYFYFENYTYHIHTIAMKQI